MISPLSAPHSSTPRSLLLRLNALHRANAAGAGGRQAPHRTFYEPRGVEVLRHGADGRHADAQHRRERVIAGRGGRGTLAELVNCIVSDG